MKILKNYAKLLLFTGLLFSAAACKKEGETPLNTIEIGLPVSFSLVYGDQQEISLPSNITNASDARISFDFSQTPNVQIGATSSLHDKMGSSLTFDKATGKIKLNTTMLYPNDEISAITGNKIPSSYKVEVLVNSAAAGFQGKQTIEIKIAAAKLDIKGLDNKVAIPFAYVLYGDAATFELEAPTSIMKDANWDINNKAAIGTDVSIATNQLRFGTNAGDPNKKAEKAYDVVPVLKKDGFNVASRSFRVFFIPKIKFFYGTYYSDLDLTLLFNNIHIALSNGYVSSAPTLYPEKYKSTFSIISIEKDGTVFSAPAGIFTINDKTGSITVAKNTSLTAGAYKFTVKAITTTGLEFTTSLTLNMSQG
jgi:hypothetical protein